MHALILALIFSGTPWGQEPVGTAQSHPLEGLLIVASTDESSLPGDPRKKSQAMATTMAHLDKNQFNPINWIPPSPPNPAPPLMFVPMASPQGRIFLFTFDEKQPDPMKQEEYRIGLPFQGLSYELTPPFLRRGTKDPHILSIMKKPGVYADRTFSGHYWSWAPDGKRLFMKLDQDTAIYSNGGARQITLTGKVPDGSVTGFAQDSNHVRISTGITTPRTFVARLPERQETVSQEELFRNAVRVPLDQESIGQNLMSTPCYSPNGKHVALVASSGKLRNSMTLFAGPHDHPREAHVARGLWITTGTGGPPATVLGQDSTSTPTQAGKPYQVKFSEVLILGWSQDGGRLYFLQSEKAGWGITDSRDPNDHKTQHTNQIWAWTADRGAEKVMDVPVLSHFTVTGCPISVDQRWLILWGIDLPGDAMLARDHTNLTVTNTSGVHLYAADLKAKTVRKLRRRSSHLDYATFTKPERWEGEIAPGFNPNVRGEELPEHFLKFTSAVALKPWQYQWALELNFEGNVVDFARRRDNLYVEATAYRPDGTPYRDSDGLGKNKDGLAASFLPFKTAQLNVSSDTFRGSYYVPLSHLEILGADKTEVDVVLRLYEGDKLRGETRPASRVTIGAAEIPRTLFKKVSVTVAEENGQPGVLVTAEAATINLSPWDLRFEAAVRHPDLQPIAARTVDYRGSDDTAAAKSIPRRPTGENEVFPVRLFIPLGELQLNRGERTVSVQLQARILEKNFVGASPQTTITVQVP